jgi:hypothetical protein
MFNNNHNNGLTGLSNDFVNNNDIGGLGNSLNLGMSSGFLGGQVGLEQNYNFGTALPDNNQMGAQTMEIRKVYLGLTRPQNDQWRRSYDVKMSGHAYSKLQEDVARFGSDALNPMNLSTMLAGGENYSILQHSGIADGAVNIDNGWDASRFRFTIVADVYRNGKFMYTEFISGYTNHDGVEHAGMVSSVTVDPNMLFTINHVTEARVRNMDAMGRPTPLISRSNAVVRNNSFHGLGQSDNLYLTRPSDILKAVDKVTLYKGMQKASQLGEMSAQTYQDLDSMLTNMPMMSSSTNLLLPTFLSRTTKGMFESSLNQFDPMNMDNTSPASLARMNVGDHAYSSSAFVNIMNRKLGNYVTSTAQFTFGDLLRMDPTIDDRTDVFGRAYETGTLAIPDGRNVDSIGSAEQVAVHATAVAHATLALMSLSGVCTLAFNATNQNTGDTEITLQACDGLDVDGMLYQRLEVFKQRLKLECLNIVAADESTYEVDVFADSFNDVFITITWRGMKGEYVFPSFASSAMAPTVTKDLNRLVGIAEAIDQVVDACKQIADPHAGGTDYTQISVQGNGEARYGGLAGEF